jgi:hypothetical protein
MRNGRVSLGILRRSCHAARKVITEVAMRSQMYRLMSWPSVWTANKL